MTIRTIWLVILLCLSSLAEYAMDSEPPSFEEFQARQRQFGFELTFSKSPSFSNHVPGMPPEVTFFPGISLDYAVERKLSGKWNYSTGIAAGVQPSCFLLNFPYWMIDHSMRGNDMYTKRVISLSAPYLQPSLVFHRLFGQSANRTFALDLGIHARFYFPSTIERGYYYAIDSVTSKTIYKESLEYSFPRSSLFMISFGIAKKIYLGGGKTQTLFASCMIPLNANLVGSYEYLPGTPASSHGGLATDNPSICFGILISMKSPEKSSSSSR